MTTLGPDAEPREAPPKWRQRLGEWLAQQWVERTLITLIVINAIILGMETYPAVMERVGPLLIGLDTAILGIFIVEIGLRIAAHGWRFFRDAWSLFDFIVVAIALVPSSGPLSVLRTLRVLRVLRMLTLLPSMRRVVSGLIGAIPGLSSVMLLMCLIFYVSAVIATGLFGERFPEWFGTLGASGYTLFQIMTLESWSMGIARPVLEVYPVAWVFFVLFILISSFTMLNLFIAVIVNATHSAAEGEASQHLDEQHDRTRAEIRALRDEMDSLRALLERSGR